MALACVTQTQHIREPPPHPASWRMGELRRLAPLRKASSAVPSARTTINNLILDLLAEIDDPESDRETSPVPKLVPTGDTWRRPATEGPRRTRGAGFGFQVNSSS